jgi:hypothetical protein
MFTKTYKTYIIIIVGGARVGRKPFTTTIDDIIQKDFKGKCNSNKDKMNDVLEAFMKKYINNEFELKVEFTLKKKG